jgi:exopolysaccharide biosynthesis polyprenyl glycosylphosphotransferase
MPDLDRITSGIRSSVSWPVKIAWAMTGTDALLVTLAVLIAQLTRFGLDSGSAVVADTGIAFSWMGVALAATWLVALSLVGSRDSRILGVGLVEYTRVINATLFTAGGLAIIAFFLKLDIARGYIAVALPLGLVLLLGGRLAWRKVVLKLRRAGRCLSSAIIVGTRADVAALTIRLQQRLGAGYRPIAVAVADGDPSAEVEGLPAIRIDDLVHVSRQTRNRAVIIAGDLPGGREQIRDLAWALEDAQTELILLSRLTEVAGPRIHLRPVEGLPMVHVDLPQYSGLNHTVKRVFDAVVAGAALLVLAPVFAALAVVIRLESSGSVIFRQERVGMGGARFTMFKFRSMVADAEELRRLMDDQNEGSGPLFKIKHDPRITRVGRFIRRYSLDELPQLWNVFIGDMSLVGPRPPLPREVELYERRVTRRLLTKPGITGLWQVSGRSSLSWDDSVKLDLYYVENWSLAGDFLILAKTVRAVVSRDGAY